MAAVAVAQSGEVTHNTWTTGTAMPTARMGAAAGAVGANIYVIDGYNISSILGVNEIYNTKKNTWTTGVSDPNPRAWPAYAMVNKMLYVFGGSNGSILDIAESYNPATDTWTTLAPMPYIQQTAVAVADKDVIYVIGGQNPSGPIASVASYNITADTWTEEAPLLGPTAWNAAGLLGTTIVSADGFGGGMYEQIVYDNVQIYQP
jgi:N-acetylneuraminic acid mutarotase